MRYQLRYVRMLRARPAERRQRYRRCAATTVCRVSDPRWPRAGDWLAAGPAPLHDADLAVLGVPTFATSITPTGAHATPAAIRRALGRLSTWCASRRTDVGELAGWDLGDVDDPDVPVEGEFRVRARSQTGYARSRLLIALGGDNSATYPVCAGAFGELLGRAGLVTLDAHHDLREGRSNGTPVRDLIGAGLDPHRIAQVGIADWANSKSYADEATARGITVITRPTVADRGINDCVREAIDVAADGGGPVYVDLDLDVCDRAVAPGCPASLPGGLSAGEILTAAFLAGRDPRVRVIDITEVDATGDAPDGRTVRLAALCLLEAAAGLALRP
jgi:formiminoglutamase